jgi:cation diffusion facilitator CzcD-associated flavoprotein CzcO
MGSKNSNVDLDVIIIGAGLSGIGAAVHLQKRCPGKTYSILEGREAIGGTWDLFRYPGIRSDSDMFTLGYDFKPWSNPKAIADGSSIRAYVREAAAEHGVDRHIRFGHAVERAEWDTTQARWTIHARCKGEVVRLTARFLMTCAGYYKYAQSHVPEWTGMKRFKGPLVVPQFWPENLDYSGKRVVVIGSGATAVTIVPAMAEKAAHVTMLQRSPTYMVSRPGQDELANRLRKLLPAKLAYDLVRTRNVLLQLLFYKLARSRPEKTKERLLALLRPELPEGFDIKKHLTPRYAPWDQRLCLVPDNDFFKALKSGAASIVTDEIESFTETGLQLKSGAVLEADIIVAATGLELENVGGIKLVVDGSPVVFGEKFLYKGMMYSGVPNCANVFGYTNASWTLKADLTCAHVCRLLNHMDKNGFAQVTPRLADPAMKPAPWVDFSSGYIQRATATLPKQGLRAPWKLHQNYILDLVDLRLAGVENPELEFKPFPAVSAASSPLTSEKVTA